MSFSNKNLLPFEIRHQASSASDVLRCSYGLHPALSSLIRSALVTHQVASSRCFKFKHSLVPSTCDPMPLREARVRFQLIFLDFALRLLLRTHFPHF